MTNRETLVELLEHYVDVQPGLADTDGGDGSWSGALLASGVWKSRTYRHLEYLLKRLRHERSDLCWHLRERYLRRELRRVAVCAKCGGERPASMVGVVHTHGQRRVTLQAAVRPILNPDIDPVKVDRAIDLLLAWWNRDVSLVPVRILEQDAQKAARRQRAKELA